MDVCTNKWIAYAIFPGGKLCFDTFIAITAWFLVNQSFRFEKFFKIFLEVLFYSVLTIGFATIMGARYTVMNWLSAFFPICGGIQGYAASYLAFYLLIPFLSKLSGITRKQNIFILIILTIDVVLVKIIGMTTDWSEQSVYCRIVLFIYFYFIMLYVKRYQSNILNNRFIMLFGTVFSWVSIFLICAWSTQYTDLACWKYLNVLICDESGILYIIGGLCMFFFFKNVHIPSNRIINWFGGSTLAVLLIHDGHYFREYFWSLFKTTQWYYSTYFFGAVVLCVFITYITCTIIDYLRKFILEKPIFSLKVFKQICIRVDGFISDES